MDIGGYDIVIKTEIPNAMLLCQKIIKQYWKDCVIELDKGPGFENDVFIYSTMEAKKIWDKEGASPDAENDMIYLLPRNKEITIVVGNPEAEPVKSILEEMKEVLRRKTDEEIAEEWIVYESQNTCSISKYPDWAKKVLLASIKCARKEEPRINCGLHIADWMNIVDEDDTMTSYYGEDYFDELPLPKKS